MSTRSQSPAPVRIDPLPVACAMPSSSLTESPAWRRESVNQRVTRISVGLSSDPGFLPPSVTTHSPFGTGNGVDLFPARSTRVTKMSPTSTMPSCTGSHPWVLRLLTPSKAPEALRTRTMMRGSSPSMNAPASIGRARGASLLASAADTR